MRAELVMHFLVLRGLWGSLSDHYSVERLYDSITVEKTLRDHGYNYPGISTIRENLNAVSEVTHRLILKCQAKLILGKNLDDFYNIYVDSTAVKGNVAYPTDISILYKIIERIYRSFTTLEKFGLPGISDGWMLTRIEKMKNHLSFMSMQAGKQGVKGKVKESYRAFSRLAMNVIDSFCSEFEKLTPYWENAVLPPAKEIALEMLWFRIDGDLNDAANVLQYADLSLNENMALQQN